MESPQTLHDFVLNLLSNADARAAFQLDPQGALHDAGLSDVDAADVRDVIPLVVDYAPRTMPGLDTTLTQLTTTAAAGGPAGAIQQLQLVTQQLPPVTAGDFTMAATGTLAGTASGLTGLAGAPVDVTHTLDSTVVGGATSTLSSVVGTTDLSHPLSTLPDVVDNTTHGVTADLPGSLPGDLPHVLGTGGILDLSGALGGSASAAGISGSGSVDASTHTEATTHTDSPLQHGVVGSLLGSTTGLLGSSDGHPLDVSHLF
jgi:hypothetical protein